jgi:hypothetical protein
MTDEHKSEVVTQKIKIGHLFDVTLPFLEKFFQEMVRSKRKDPRVFAVPSECRKHFDWQTVVTNVQLVPTFVPTTFQAVVTVSPSSAPLATQKDTENGYKPKTSPTHYICTPLPTQCGPALIVDEIKTGTRMKYYRVWLNGEDRYFTETQLKYAMEVK